MKQDRLCPKCHNLINRAWGKRCRRCYYLSICTPCIDCGTLCDPDALRCRRCTDHRQRQDYDTDRLRALHAEGVKISEIGRLLGVSKNTISGYCDRNGLTRKYDGPTSMQRLDALWDRLNCTLPAWVAEWHNINGTPAPSYYLPAIQNGATAPTYGMQTRMKIIEGRANV